MRQEGGQLLRIGTSGAPSLISVITVVYNSRPELISLLQSVASHKSQDVELIVIDGGSTDGTLELLQSQDSNIDYWLSEPDRGIYDAMNKGISKARGYFLLHLNAGDQLLSLPIGDLEIARSQDIDIAAFQVLLDGKRKFHPSGGIRLRFNNTLH